MGSAEGAGRFVEFPGQFTQLTISGACLHLIDLINRPVLWLPGGVGLKQVN